MKLTSAVQEALLALLFYDAKAAPEVAALIAYKLYDPYYSELAEAAQGYISEFGEVPGEHTLDIVDLLCEREPDKAEFYRLIFKSIQNTRKGINREYVLSRATAFTRYQTLKRGLAQAARALQREDEEGLSEATRLLRNALETTSASFDLGCQLSDLTRSLAFLRSPEANTFPTGIPALDERELGPARKRLFLFIGLAGAGKSHFLGHLAKYSYIARQRVLYVTLELTEEELCQRTFQGLFSVAKRDEPIKLARFERDDQGTFLSIQPGHEIRRPSLEQDDIDEFLSEKGRKLRHKVPFYIKEFPTGSLSVRGLENYLDQLEAKSKFIPDLLIVDYADLMSLDAKNYRLDVGQLYKNLRGLANKRNLAVATASQANRAAVKSKWLTGDSAAEDWSKIATADTVVTYNQTPAEHALGLARLFVAKGRTDKDKFAILVSQAYAVGQFALDSVSYKPSYWDDLNSQVTEGIDTGTIK